MTTTIPGRLGAATLLFTAMACTGQTPSPDAATGKDRSTCNSEAYETLIGENAAAISLPATLDHRIIAPDMAVTQDYKPERINFYTDEDGVIERIECG